MTKRKIPGPDEWSGYDQDGEIRHAYKLMFGKAIADLQLYFGGVQSIQRAHELLFMPRRAFQYYVLAFSEFMRSDSATDDSDSASSFLRLLLAREKRDPGSVAEIYTEVAPVVDVVANHQDHFGADPNIYGDFQQLAGQLRAVCGDLASDPRRG